MDRSLGISRNVLIALFVGGAIGFALGEAVRISATGNSDASKGYAEIHNKNAAEGQVGRSLISKLQHPEQYAPLDLGFFAAVEIAYRTVGSNYASDLELGREAVLCFAIVGLVKERDFMNQPPTIPDVWLNWIRPYYPSVAALPECIESWGTLERIQMKPAYKDARLVIVGWPKWVFPSFAEVMVNHVVPGGIHTYGSRYLLQIKRTDVTLVGEDLFRTY
jgi:hypothetical protein